MRAVVLAAGKGTRLNPLSDTRPKSMIPVGGKPILEHLLLSLKESGIDGVLLVIGYLGKFVRNEFKDGSDLGIDLGYVEQEELLGTADALATSEGFVEEDDFLVVNGDLFVSPEAITPLLTAEYANRNVMAVVKVDDAETYGVVRLSQDHVEEITEKPVVGQTGSPWVNAGIYRMNKSVFDIIRQVSYSSRGELELTDAINMLINSDQRVLAVQINSKDWMDIGKPWDLLEANERVLTGLDRKIAGNVEKGAYLHGPIILARGARIRSGTYIEGPVVIGEGSDIGPNCFLRPYTSVGCKVRIGNACEIKNSIILDRTHIGHLSYIGDSILGQSCNLGAGTITANLRLDDANIKVMVKSQLSDSGRRKFGVVMGDRVKTGINVSTMPGVKIGHDSWIGPNTTLTRDVEPNTLVVQKTQYEISSIK